MPCLLMLYSQSIICNPWIFRRITARIKEPLFELKVLVTERHLLIEDKLGKNLQKTVFPYCYYFCKLDTKPASSFNKLVQVPKVNIHSVFLGHILPSLTHPALHH